MPRKKKTEVDILVDLMRKKGYLLEMEDGSFTPRCYPPPDDEEKDLQEFWKYLVQEISARKFKEALIEERFRFIKEK